jgi:hypothetical protein
MGKFPLNLMILKPPSNKIQLAYFYLLELIQKIQFAMTNPVGCIDLIWWKWKNSFTVIRSKLYVQWIDITKGHLISEWNFGVFKSP